jgi:hypothetical protein
MLLRAIPEKTESYGLVKALGTDDAPICTL